MYIYSSPAICNVCTESPSIALYFRPTTLWMYASSVPISILFLRLWRSSFTGHGLTMTTTDRRRVVSNRMLVFQTRASACPRVPPVSIGPENRESSSDVTIVSVVLPIFWDVTYRHYIYLIAEVSEQLTLFRVYTIISFLHTQLLS